MRFSTVPITDLAPGDLIMLKPGAWVAITELVRNGDKVTVTMKDGAGTERTLTVPATESGSALRNPSVADHLSLVGTAHVLPKEVA